MNKRQLKKQYKKLKNKSAHGLFDSTRIFISRGEQASLKAILSGDKVPGHRKRRTRARARFLLAERVDDLIIG